MEVQTKALALANYTIDNAAKDKIVPKRLRWVFGNRLASAALDMLRHIDMANTLRLDRPKEAEERHLEQVLALGESFNLSSLVHLLRMRSKFSEDTHMYWTGLIAEVQELLRSWMESDRKRIGSADATA